MQLEAPTVEHALGQERVQPLHHLQHAIDHAAHYLPAQGPITVFIHHNTLHAFEEMQFDEAVQEGGRVFGCAPYLTEDQYRQRLASQRIRQEDLSATLAADLDERGKEQVARLVSRYDLRLGMLQHPVRSAGVAELRWFVAETDALSRFRADAPDEYKQRMIAETRHWVMRDLLPKLPTSPRPATSDEENGAGVHELLADLGAAKIEALTNEQWESLTLRVLWRVCRQGVHGGKQHPTPPAAPVRHRDLLLEVTGVDTDLLVNEILIRFCSSFLDQGMAQWSLPARDEGFLKSFQAVYAMTGGPPDPWLRGVAEQFAKQRDEKQTPLENVLSSLAALGVPEEEWESYITATLLSLRGWAGMIRQMEVRTDRAAHPVPPGTLVEYLAVRLLLERLALTSVAKSELNWKGDLGELREHLSRKVARPETETVEQRAFNVFQLAQVLGWLPADLLALSKQDWGWLLAEIEAFPQLERRRIFHAAFERKYRHQVLDAVALHAEKRFDRVVKPRFQLICCLDEREESFRRHLEEIAPDVETFGVAGFYNVAMYYRGAADAHFVPLCPIVIRPQHWVTESAVYSLDESHRRRAQTRKILGTVSHEVHRGSRTFAGGAFLAAGLGALASIPLVARVLFPRLTSRIRRTASSWLQPPKITQLELERQSPEASPDDGHRGFTLDEMVNIGERLLRDIGLTKSFARIVVALGHGSNSVNNPHKSAYDCGACGGNAGGPNARAIARILNDSRVRQQLKQRGLEVPDDTWFVGGFHNTCNDEVTYLDLDRLPPTHRVEFDRIEANVMETCQRNAHERCRRFMSAPLNMSFKAAKKHVEARAEDLAQTRPECGHATNAICYVGRRSRVRGLYMDRRCFLTSYDPTEDDDQQNILLRLLQAAVPVCGGINLEYYFSYVDPSGFGCGTKLPHNITSLLGIMDGAASDLRTGLPWQMVEIHEPVRLLFVIETTPDAMLRIMDKNEVIGRMCRNDWVQVSTLSPDGDTIHVLRNGKFEQYKASGAALPQATSSAHWYRGWREHLGFAQIEGQG